MKVPLEWSKQFNYKSTVIESLGHDKDLLSYLKHSMVETEENVLSTRVPVNRLKMDDVKAKYGESS